MKYSENDKKIARSGYPYKILRSSSSPDFFNCGRKLIGIKERPINTILSKDFIKIAVRIFGLIILKMMF